MEQIKTNKLFFRKLSYVAERFTSVLCQKPLVVRSTIMYSLKEFKKKTKLETRNEDMYIQDKKIDIVRRNKRN